MRLTPDEIDLQTTTAQINKLSQIYLLKLLKVYDFYAFVIVVIVQNKAKYRATAYK